MTEFSPGPESESPCRHHTSLDWYDRSFAESSQTAGFAAPGIILAGVAYPILVAVGAMATAILNGYWQVGSLLSGLIMIVIASFSISPLLAMIGLVISSLVIPAFNAAIGFGLKARKLLSLVGGLAAFLPFAALHSATSHYSLATTPLPDLVWFLAFSGLALLMGQYGAIWAGAREQHLGALRHRKPPALSNSANRTQFSLVRIFSITTCVASFLAVDRLMDFELTVVTAVYAALQLTALLLDWFILGLIDNSN